MNELIKKFHNFANENVENLDPFQEEDWSDEEKDRGRTKDELIEDCISDVMDDLYNSRDYIIYVLREKFNRMTKDELREFLGYAIEEVECPDCLGTGRANDGFNICQTCLGTGYIEE